MRTVDPDAPSDVGGMHSLRKRLAPSMQTERRKALAEEALRIRTKPQIHRSTA